MTEETLNRALTLREQIKSMENYIEDLEILHKSVTEENSGFTIISNYGNYIDIEFDHASIFSHSILEAYKIKMQILKEEFKNL